MPSSLIEMPIPSTRVELVDQITAAYAKLQDEVQSAGPEIAALACVDEWSVKDLLAVRAWWTHSVIDWVEAGKRGKPLALPAPGYLWNETPRLNGEIVAATSNDTFDAILQRLDQGFARVIKCVDSLSDHELLDVGVFEWAGKWPVSRWVSLNTGRQYTTARTFIRKSLRNRGSDAPGPEGAAS